MKRVWIGAIAILLMTAGVAVAAPGGKKGQNQEGPSGSIELAEGSAAVAEATAGPSYGDTVSFEVETNNTDGNKTRVFVRVSCMQDGAAVYRVVGAPDAAFELTDPASSTLEWHSGAADCMASLVYEVTKGQNVSYTTLDLAHFAVAA